MSPFFEEEKVGFEMFLKDIGKGDLLEQPNLLYYKILGIEKEKDLVEML